MGTKSYNGVQNLMQIQRCLGRRIGLRSKNNQTFSKFRMRKILQTFSRNFRGGGVGFRRATGPRAGVFFARIERGRAFRRRNQP